VQTRITFFILCLAGLLILSGCATGSAKREVAYRQIDDSIINGGYSEGVNTITTAQQGKNPIYDKKNAISLFLDKGLLEHYAGDYRSSSQSLENAERLIQEAFTKSVSESVGSYILNDNTKEYPGEDFEDIYINVFNALNYFQQGNIEGSLVEVRKLTIPNGKLNLLERKYEEVNAKARRANEKELSQGGGAPQGKNVTFTNSALARYLSVLFYNAERNEDAARIELEQLREAFRSQPNIYKHPMPEAINKLQIPSSNESRLDILAFTGLSPIKQEKIFYQNFPFFQSQDLQKPLFKLPVLVRRKNKVNSVEIIEGGQKQSLELLEDMGTVITDTFNARFSSIFLKTYIRTLVKYTALDIIDKQAKQKASGSKFGGLAADGGMMLAKNAFDATETADVRMARYLPGKAFVGSINLSPGNHNITINYLSNGELLHSETKQSFIVSASKVNLLQLVNLGIDINSSEVDDNVAVSFGKFVGTDLVITGGLFGSGDFRRLRLKVLDVNTFIIHGTASVPLQDVATAPPVATVTVPAVVNTQPVVTSVVVSPSTASIIKGQTQKFNAVVNGSNNPSQSVNWTVTGSQLSTTTIDANGLLSVASNETAASLTVTATAKADQSKKSTATVTVTNPPPVVTGITVSPSTASVIKGQTQVFSAVVNGSNNPSQTVSWTVTGGQTGTSISTSGLLTIASSETVASLTVRATFTLDTSKSGTATVAVSLPPPTVTSVVVNPPSVYISAGSTQVFSATVNGSNNPAQIVTWTVTSGQTDININTTINADGLLTIIGTAYIPSVMCDLWSLFFYRQKSTLDKKPQIQNHTHSKI